MRASSAELLEIARAAGVRVTVAFHAAVYRKELKGKATPEGYAGFTDLPLEAAQRVFSVLDSIPQPERRPKQKAPETKLAHDWQIPNEWLLWACTEKGWPRDVAETVGARFKDNWLSKGTARADWLATWRNWVRSPYSPESVVSGAYTGPARDWSNPTVIREQREATIRLYKSMGRHDEAKELQRELDGL